VEGGTGHGKFEGQPAGGGGGQFGRLALALVHHGGGIGAHASPIGGYCRPEGHQSGCGGGYGTPAGQPIGIAVSGVKNGTMG